MKAHRDYLNKTTHLYLFVRHQFKCGLLNELKRDLHAAYKHYGQAYRDPQSTDENLAMKEMMLICVYHVLQLKLVLKILLDL